MPKVPPAAAFAGTSGGEHPVEKLAGEALTAATGRSRAEWFARGVAAGTPRR
ncbi:hypothetical protein [Streptomyces roseolus]|uniref:hypothetical protein n=1 Tax=Streptomyces roseolus TaxID=67358 RepID=UPI0036633A0A